MSQNIRAVPRRLAAPRQHLERRRVGLGEHVGLVDPGEALDRRAVEADALVERALELGRRDRDRLEEAEHVGEPQPHEADVALLERPEHELLLLVHGAESASGCRQLAAAGTSTSASSGVAGLRSMSPQAPRRMNGSIVTTR